MKSVSAERRLQIHLNHLMPSSSSGESLLIEANQTNAQSFLENNQTRAVSSSSRSVDVGALKAFVDGKYAHVSF